MSKKHSTLGISEVEAAAAEAVKRAVEARQQAGIEITGEQLNSISGGASYYLKDPFIYGIKVDPNWLFNTSPVLNQQTISLNKTIAG